MLDPNGPHLPKVMLDTGYALYELAVDDQALVIGHDPNCDVPVPDERVGQFHACVVCEDGRFLLADDSSSGTYLSIQGGRPRYLQREEVALFGSGLIFLGDPDTPRDLRNTVRYTIIDAL